MAMTDTDDGMENLQVDDLDLPDDFTWTPKTQPARPSASTGTNRHGAVLRTTAPGAP